MSCRSTLWRNKPHNKIRKSPKQRATIAKGQVIIETSAVNSNEKRTKSEITRKVLTKIAIILVVKRTLTPTKKFLTIPTQTNQVIKKKTKGLNLSTHPVRPVVKLTIPQRNVTSEQMQQTDRLPGVDDRKDKTKSDRERLKATQMRMFKLQPKLQTRNATFSLRSCIWQTLDNWITKTSTNSRGYLAATLGDTYKSM